MKIVPLALLFCLALPLCADAKTKAKPKSKSAAARHSKATEPQPVKNKLIDMTPPAGENPEGLLISTTLNGKDIEFLQNALEIGGLESWLGAQASHRGEADRVKAVGDALQETQAEETKRLAELAKRKGVALPEAATKTASLQKVEQQLAKLSGPGFDKAVLEQISLATEQELEAYQSAVASADPEVKQLATLILPLVREKLVLANRLAGKALPPGAKPGFRENAPPVPQ
jgi:predicted outer membrane protein